MVVMHSWKSSCLNMRAELSDIPESVKTEVRRIHQDLGHLARVLLRMAKLARKSEQHLRYIRHFVSPACVHRRTPGHPPKARQNQRASISLLPSHLKAV
eukprot:3650365-Amphidinium_carterae.4